MTQLVKYQEQKQELDYFRTLAGVASKGGTHNMTPETLMNIMLTAKDLGISPMKAINGGFYVVNGKISMSTALMADRIRKEGHSIKIPEWTSQKCVVIGVRKDNGDSVKFEFTMEDAQAAGLTKNPTWQKFPKQMLYNRAMATLARTLFPDVVGNAYSEEEKWDIMNVPPEKRPDEDPDAMLMEPSKVISVAPAQAVPVVESMEFENDTNSKEKVRKMLAADNIPTSFLDEYLINLSQKKNQPVEQITDCAVMQQMYPKFKQAYLKEMSLKYPQSEPVVA